MKRKIRFIFYVSLSIVFLCLYQLKAEEIIRLNLEVAVTDQIGQRLKYGQVSIDDRATWQYSPQTYTTTNGGSFNLSGKWLAIYSKEKTVTVFKDTTYWIDALSGEIRSQNTPKINKINFVFNMTPNEVMATTKDYLSNNQPLYFLHLFEQFDLAAIEVSKAVDAYNKRKLALAIASLRDAQIYLQSFINTIQSQLDINQLDLDLGNKTIVSAKTLIAYLEQLKSEYR